MDQTTYKLFRIRRAVLTNDMGYNTIGLDNFEVLQLDTARSARVTSTKFWVPLGGISIQVFSIKPRCMWIQTQRTSTASPYFLLHVPLCFRCLISNTPWPAHFAEQFYLPHALVANRTLSSYSEGSIHPCMACFLRRTFRTSEETSLIRTTCHDSSLV